MPCSSLLGLRRALEANLPTSQSYLPGIKKLINCFSWYYHVWHLSRDNRNVRRPRCASSKEASRDLQFSSRSVENVRRVIERHVKPHARSCKIRWWRATHARNCQFLAFFCAAQTKCRLAQRPLHEIFIAKFLLPRILVKSSSPENGVPNIIVKLSPAENGVPTLL